MIFILQVSNMFIMSLALADLTVGVIVMPITSAYTITGNFEMCDPCVFYYTLFLLSISPTKVDSFLTICFYS